MDIHLLPQPQKLTQTEGSFSLAPASLILLESPTPGALRHASSRVQQALAELGLDWQVVASLAVPKEQIGVALRQADSPVKHPQGYALTITAQGIDLRSSSEAGLFYGACTLAQLLRSPEAIASHTLPCLEIMDWPDFPARGVMLDISRDKVPTLETLYALVDLLASWKINQFQLYTEHTFAYRNHPDVWAKASPVSGQDILDLDAYCRQRFVELVPNQNSFGHMHRWFDHPRYAPLGELYQVEAQGWWGRGSYSLCPLDPGSLKLITGLYDELLPHFSSRMFNVGCDETFDLGQGRSKRACEERGKGRVYLDFLLKIYADVTARGRTMQFWGDIIMQHPELVPELPRDVIALEWGYDADHPFAEHGQHFASSGIPFYVCPGTSSWNTVAGRTDNALGNILSAAQNGLQHGASGLLNTDWGDNGHWQYLPISYLGFAAGAAFSWSLEANRSLDVADALNRFAFRDPVRAMGHVAYDLGNVYQSVPIPRSNGSGLFKILQTPAVELRKNLQQVTPEAFTKAQEAIQQAIQSLTRTKPDIADASLVLREFSSAARILHHACQRGLWIVAPEQVRRDDLDKELLEIEAEYQELWLSRNRPGGLQDSLARYEKTRSDYQN